ncbi:exported hypothetical protein [Candidatus Sulfotelmatobacter kueseliae]|uniref:Uncharacterized protein n=1 Tax=Candidatus Sulfotelmatobacter kueseliae TaxID=2042962 RepID=A0A2U3KU46_9BACT|nr:exported hypothetical protein [Candidatus Sulfotelmatobacter kueseliae]
MSSSILISSRITPRSRTMSAASKTGFRTRSLRMSSAVGICSSSTFTLKQMHSLAVNASMLPPIESTWRAISSAVRCCVPLNTMCSMKWEIPFHSASSSREPVSSQMPMEAERMCGICSVMIVRPLGSACRRILRTSRAMSASCSYENYFYTPVKLPWKDLYYSDTIILNPRGGCARIV